jgi:multidrug efflux pump
MLMLAFEFSLNLLTLLAMLLAIGLVVDDAIVVVENVHRHITMGKTPFKAALDGARELGLPILSMTTTLLAVYAPIAFMGGMVGILFTEFAFSLAGAVLVSGIVALTFSPMLASKVLNTSDEPERFETAGEHFFENLALRYRRWLHNALDYQPVTFVFAAVVVTTIYFMFVSSTAELAPTEDREVLNIQMTAPETATLEYATAHAKSMVDMFEAFPEHRRSFIMIGGGGSPATTFGGFRILPVAERERSQMEIQPILQGMVREIAGAQIAVFSFPSLPELASEMVGAAYASGKFLFLNKSVDFALPQTKVLIDRDRAGDLGIDMDDIGITLATMLGGNNVNRFSLAGRSYEVIPQVQRRFRASHDLLDENYIRAASGDLIPLSSIVSFEHSIEPTRRSQFQQLNSVTINGVTAPGVSLGDAIAFMEDKASELFPREFAYDYVGESRQFKQQGSALILTFFLSIVVIYLVLAAQFESWRDPLIILISVPMSIAGALIFVTLGFASINLYTQVGLITLIGLIAKNGILIVDFANRLRTTQGLSKREAVEQAAAVRLRPILMTTVAMLMAMVPLLIATGPGAVSRFQIGLVIVTGLGIGTVFTLWVVPSFYLLLARPRQQAEASPEAHPTVEAIP